MPDGLPGGARVAHPAGVIGARALSALETELRLAPKPGLVVPGNPGSHQDMDVGTFQRSLAALRGYFPDIAAAGAAGAGFAALRTLGMAAEQAMLRATGGVNTHRGAIFNLGLLCAAAGALAADGTPATPERLCAAVSRHWGAWILAGAPGDRHAATPSHGHAMAVRHGAGGARAEAAGGFPSARRIGLPALRAARAAGADPEAAAVQALFALIAAVEDTNLLWRGGPAGLAFARQRAAEFLARGGVQAPDWRSVATRIGSEFVARRLSPGGSADLLGVTLFLHDS